MLLFIKQEAFYSVFIYLPFYSFIHVLVLCDVSMETSTGRLQLLLKLFVRLSEKRGYLQEENRLTRKADIASSAWTQLALTELVSKSNMLFLAVIRNVLVIRVNDLLCF